MKYIVRNIRFRETDTELEVPTIYTTTADLAAVACRTIIFHNIDLDFDYHEATFAVTQTCQSDIRQPMDCSIALEAFVDNYPETKWLEVLIDCPNVWVVDVDQEDVFNHTNQGMTLEEATKQAIFDQLWNYLPVNVIVMDGIGW